MEWMDPTKTISRTHTYHYKLLCTLDRRFNVTNAQITNVDESRKTFKVISKANFSARMDFYISDAYSTVAASPLKV